MIYNQTYNLMRHGRKILLISALIMAVCLISLLAVGLNYGVDFSSGTSLDITLGKSADPEKIREVVAQTDVEPETITIGGDNNRVTLRYDRVLGDEVKPIVERFTSEFGEGVSYEEYTVDPEIARELVRKAIIALLVASVGISLYISLRFEWRFAVAAVIALFFDALIVVGFFSIFRLEVNLPFVVAVLTIVGYSINDTIVIFDRIRENLRLAKIKTYADLEKLVSQSLWQTMTRSINTVLTVLFAAVCLFILGSESIRLFSLAMIVGLISGAFSSLFIASPLWLLFRKNNVKFGKKAVAKG